jgi:glycosyltransferase involved in cell wall biosynthesis
MRIVAVYRYFWPDNAPYGRILKKLLANFVSYQNNCMVISGYPAYNFDGSKNIASNEIVEGVLVKRVGGRHFRNRIFDFIIFLMASFFVLLKNRSKYDLLLINSFPPVLMGVWGRFVSSILKKKYIYYIQDVHPECLYYSGTIKNKYFFWFLKHLDRMNVDKSAATVTLSSDMKEELISRGCQPEKIFIVNNPAQSEFRSVEHINLPKEFPVDKFVILFAGNIGRFQNLDLIVESAKFLRHNDQIVFVFMGNGTAKDELEKQAGDCVGKNIIFIPYQKPEVAGKAMQTARLGLVSLKPEITRFAYPSKIPTLLCHGCPILALVEEKSELAKMILKNNFGYVTADRNPKKIAHFIEDIWENRFFYESDKNSFKEKVKDTFGFDTLLNKWRNILNFIR